MAIGEENWSIFANCDRQQLTEILLDLAARVNFKRFLKQSRAPLKKKEPPDCDSRHRHASTARPLKQAQQPPRRGLAVRTLQMVSMHKS
jgi:hypothetical protein